jgi:ABC-type multidrug transport system ATPase subunit
MIEVRNLTKRYGDFVAVNDVSLDIRDGETFALLGPNGSGKTTLLKCLVGLSVPTRGGITINSLPLNESSREARRMMSFLPQRLSFHDNLTAREVLRFYCDLRKLPLRRIDEVLGNERFDFNGFCHKPVGDLSGGMVQRLGLAVACLPDAPILILDEPTVSLDPEGAIKFREFLQSLKAEGKTIIFSSHVLADVEQLADRVAVLVGGRLVAVESTSELRDELMRSCRMRIVVNQPSSSLCEAAERAGAREAVFNGEYLLVTSRAEDRMKVLRAIEDAGSGIERFATEELSLEDIYLHLIRGSGVSGEGKTN